MGLILKKRKVFIPSAPPLIRPRRWLPDVRRRIVPATNAVTFDVAGTNQKASALGTTGISYTGPNISAGLTNGALVVFVGADLDINTVTAVWDSGGSNQTMTAVGNTAVGVGGICSVHAFGLVAPTSGNKTLLVKWNAVTAETYIGAASWSNVDQTGGTTSFPHYNGATDASPNTAPTVTITSATGNAVMAMLVDDNTISSVSGTVLWTIDNSGPQVSVVPFRSAGNTPNVVMSGTLNGAGSWTIGGVDILAAAGGASASTLSLMGVG